MEFDTCDIIKEWEQYFATKSIDVKKYQTSYNLLFAGKKNTFKLELRVSTLNYGNFYAWELITNQTTISQKHPFEFIERDDIRMYQDEKQIYIHGINAKNNIMDSLFEFIIMNDEELDKNSGSLDSSHYRSLLVKILRDLVD